MATAGTTIAISSEIMEMTIRSSTRLKAARRLRPATDCGDRNSICHPPGTLFQISTICTPSAHINHDRAYYTHSSPGKQAQRQFSAAARSKAGLPASFLQRRYVSSPLIWCQLLLGRHGGRFRPDGRAWCSTCPAGGTIRRCPTVGRRHHHSPSSIPSAERVGHLLEYLINSNWPVCLVIPAKAGIQQCGG